MTGNFPQALTHVALINTIINLHSLNGPSRQRSSTDHVEAFLPGYYPAVHAVHQGGGLAYYRNREHYGNRAM
jgi:hypothetical protein